MTKRISGISDDYERLIWCVAFANEQKRWGINVDTDGVDTNVRMANAAVEAYRAAMSPEGLMQ